MESDKNLSLMNETSKITFIYTTCFKSGKHEYSSEFQKKYLDEKLEWKELKPESKLCWNKFAQFFVFPKPVKFSVKTYFEGYNENEIKKLAKAFKTSFHGEKRKYDYKVSTEQNAIIEIFHIKIPCVMLARKKLLNPCVVKSCSGKILASNVGVSDKNSSWIRSEIIKFYEPPLIKIEIKE
jgi:hypothetical protein